MQPGIALAWSVVTNMKARGVLASWFAVVAMGTALAACGQDKIEVRRGESTDYNNAALLAAVDKFVAGGRTPDAYAELSQTAFELRSGMAARGIRKVAGRAGQS